VAPVEDVAPAVVGAVLAGSGSTIMRDLGARISLAEHVESEEERRDVFRATARRAFEVELDAVKRTPPAPEPVGMTRDEVQAELDAIREGDDPCTE
jgi:hypothetical protein